MELIKVGEKTYYIKNNTNIGVYKINDKEVFLIDTGNDKDAGKKILKIMEENNFIVKGIINTHSHADHVGGNSIIQNRTNAKIYSYGIECDITNHPLLEPSLLYGAYPLIELRNKFLEAKPSVCESIDNLPNGLEYIALKGHSFDMIGIKTSDDVYFLGDSLFNKETINKYGLAYIYDINEFLKSLDILETLNGKIYIPSHNEQLNDIKDLIKINRDKVYEIMDKLLTFCKDKTTFETILKYIFEEYNLIMNTNQYYLISTTLKAYLSYLCSLDKMTFEFNDNIMYWKTIN